MGMTNLETYAKRYRHVAMERHEGIIQATLRSVCARMHTGGGPTGLQVSREAPKPAEVGIPSTAWATSTMTPSIY